MNQHDSSKETIEKNRCCDAVKVSYRRGETSVVRISREHLSVASQLALSHH